MGIKETIILLMLSILLMAAGCEKYEVPAGKHYSKYIPQPFNDTILCFTVETNWTWIFPPPENNGWSKIYGFCNGKEHIEPEEELPQTDAFHQNNSARLAFRNISVNNRVVTQLGAYCYNNGVRHKVYLEDAIIPHKYTCEIEKKPGKYIFRIDNREYEVEGNYNFAMGYILYPYIGGTYTIDHDFICPIERLDCHE